MTYDDTAVAPREEKTERKNERKKDCSNMAATTYTLRLNGRYSECHDCLTSASVLSRSNSLPRRRKTNTTSTESP